MYPARDIRVQVDRMLAHMKRSGVRVTCLKMSLQEAFSLRSRLYVSHYEGIKIKLVGADRWNNPPEPTPPLRWGMTGGTNKWK